MLSDVRLLAVSKKILVVHDSDTWEKVSKVPCLLCAFSEQQTFIIFRFLFDTFVLNFLYVKGPRKFVF